MLKRDKFTLRESVLSDCDALAERLRERDIRELQLSFGLDAKSALFGSLQNSKICLTVEDRFGDPQITLGVGKSQFPDVGIAWLLSSLFIYDVKFEFLRYGPKLFRFLSQGHNILHNWVHSDNDISLKWLTSLGFEVVDHDKNFAGRGAHFDNVMWFSNAEYKALYKSTKSGEHWQWYNQESWDEMLGS